MNFIIIHKLIFFSFQFAYFILRYTEIYRIVSQNVSTPMDKAVESILKWLQTRYKQKNRIGKSVVKYTVYLDPI